MSTVRSHNEGTLFYRKRDGRWVAKVSMPDGSRPSASSPDRAEAKRLLAELIRLRDAGARPDDHRLTVGIYLRRWLEGVRPNLAPATYRKHESVVRAHLSPALGHRRLSELSVGDVRRFLAGSNLSPQSVRHHRATLRRALADAYRDGLVARNVAALAEAPPMKRRERPILSPPEVRKVIDATREDRMHAFYVLALTTGMREAEMLGLEWTDVDLERREAFVRQTLQRIGSAWELRVTKTAKSTRTVPLPPVTVAALREHRRRQLADQVKAGKLGKTGLVFTSPTGAPLHGSNLLPGWHATLARLGLPRITIHDCRHTAATALIADGYPIAKVAAILGHSSSRVTEVIYSHLKGRDLADAADVMERLYGAVS
jgi:integrase